MSMSLAFLDYVSRSELRQYTILLDCSETMKGTNEAQAMTAIEALLPNVCKADPEGISLTLFADSFISAGPIKDATSAKRALATMAGMAKDFHTPSHLDNALQAAIEEHFRSTRRATSILVVSTGEFKDGMKVALSISNAIHAMKAYYELSISFLQVGHSAAGGAFLAQLQEDVAALCRWPIVDCLPLSGVPAHHGGLGAFLAKASEQVKWEAAREAGPQEASHWVSPTRPLDFQRRRSTNGTSTTDALSSENFALVSLAFFASLLRRETKAYHVLLDCSEGMPLADYNVARHVLARTLGSVYELNREEGISVWMMQGANVSGTQFITDGETVDRIFRDHLPGDGGKTRLSLALHQAVSEYFRSADKGSRPTSMLVVVSGPPMDWRPASDLLVKAAMEAKYDRNLSFSLLNVGTGWDWTTQFTAEVNNRAKFPLVDSYQLPANAEARRASMIIGQERDVVHNYVENFLPASLLPSSFRVQSSEEFLSYHFP